MLHARPDYQDRFQDAAGLIPDDEPVFLIRGQDLAAIPAARAWCQAADDLGADPAIIQLVERHIERVHEWQMNRVGKVPDLPS
jgi:hypothetical protein